MGAVKAFGRSWVQRRKCQDFPMHTGKAGELWLNTSDREHPAMPPPARPSSVATGVSQARRESRGASTRDIDVIPGALPETLATVLLRSERFKVGLAGLFSDARQLAAEHEADAVDNRTDASGRKLPDPLGNQCFVDSYDQRDSASARLYSSLRVNFSRFARLSAEAKTSSGSDTAVFIPEV